MLENLPPYISITFGMTTLATLGIFFWILKSARTSAIKISLGLVFWLVFQALLTLAGIYYLNMDALPPKLVLFGIFPNIVTIITLFNTKVGQDFIDGLSIERITYLHLVRVPVELVLLWLFLEGTIPEMMTFEGWNFDIVMGLSAPLIIYFGFKRQSISEMILLSWNILGLLLLAFIFAIAFLSAPFPLQQLAFDQPNIALLYFPFSWLPTFIVPMAVFAHLVSLRQLLKKS